MFDNTDVLFYSNRVGHYGCVNALGFSPREGKWLCSGSDDKRVLLWTVMGPPYPQREYRGRASNIFCTIFSWDSRYIISCGNDQLILRYDLERVGNPVTKDPGRFNKAGVQGGAAVYKGTDIRDREAIARKSNENLSGFIFYFIGEYFLAFLLAK